MIEKIIYNDYGINETFNKFLANIVPYLKIIPSKKCETKNPVQNAINRFKNHPSIKMIISKTNPKKYFLFAQFCTMKF